MESLKAKTPIVMSQASNNFDSSWASQHHTQQNIYGLCHSISKQNSSTEECRYANLPFFFLSSLTVFCNYWRMRFPKIRFALYPLPIMARFVVEKNSLRVTSPDSIRGTHDSAIGNFGIPQYGGSMAGTVLYSKDNRKGCRGFGEFGISFKSRPGSLPTFVLVDRGGIYPFRNFV